MEEYGVWRAPEAHDEHRMKNGLEAGRKHIPNHQHMTMENTTFDIWFPYVVLIKHLEHKSSIEYKGRDWPH